MRRVKTEARAAPCAPFRGAKAFVSKRVNPEGPAPCPRMRHRLAAQLGIKKTPKSCQNQAKNLKNAAKGTHFGQNGGPSAVPKTGVTGFKMNSVTPVLGTATKLFSPKEGRIYWKYECQNADPRFGNQQRLKILTFVNFRRELADPRFWSRV